MVRLDKNKIRGTLTRSAIEEKKPEPKPAPEESAPPAPEGGDLEKFSQYVLKQLIDENVPPTPSNFQIY
jgi:hypothetical protein